MDGMDGLAGMQAIGACISLSVVARVSGNNDIAAVTVIVGAAAAGFLLHNMPPARIFMGDAGSTYLGFTFAAFAVLGLRRSYPLPLSATTFGLAPFLLDGTFTLVRRMSRGEKLWKPHRSHLYQRAVATRLTHRDVLEPYCVWMAGGFACAALAASAGGVLTCGLLSALWASLGGVWWWVTRRERATANAHDATLQTDL
jgi:UDP-N-acetylmuramyl pentapeptide phosphotransferase/UDP-N-acetylglucosamine-1-phosphate transferase